ncbi:HlyC/CorC family transporter [candidate division WOR-3 bacterium]|nr:HlyC/CorC family transporter [candidate division WOR-3 bacterium]
MFILLAGTGALLILSAVFSGSEAAFFSIPSWRADSPKLKHLLNQPQRLLGTLLLANLMVNTTATALFTLFLLNLARRTGINTAAILGIGGVVMTGLLLVFGEISPKVIARLNPEKSALLLAPIIRVTYLVLSPFTQLLDRLNALLTTFPQEKTTLTDDELHTMIELGKEKGVLLPGEEEILRNLVDLDRRTVSEVMTPRKDIVAVAEHTPVSEAIRACRESGFSRLPIFRDNLEQITGVVYAKELITAPNPDAPVKTFARTPYFVPEVKKLLPLLDELRRKNSHIAIVVDEFGQTAGLVTLEDILEAIFGEITDEFDLVEELPYQKIADHAFLVDGEIDLATLNRLFSNAFRAFYFERLAALIQDRLGRLPQPGDRIELNNLEIIVQEVSEHKLEKVLIKHRKT